MKSSNPIDTNLSSKSNITSGNNYFCVDNLVVSFGKTEVVRGLSMQLQQGEIGCFLGFSGCGKTTALRAIAGLERPQQGVITLNGKTLTSVMANSNTTNGSDMIIAPAKRGMGMVFQDYALFTHLTVSENIGFGLHRWAKSERIARVQEMLALIDLTEHANKRISELSGGQQQRIALARALAPKPDLLLLDEPFSNLDMMLRETLAAKVRDILKRTNTTAILVTHDQHEAFAIADKIGVMHKGRIAQWATPSDLYHQPNSPFIAEFVGEGAMIDGVIENGVIKTALGDITQRAGEPCRYDYPNGTQTKLLIRPDDIVHDDASPHQATVLGRVFRGANYLYQLQLDSGEQVLSLIPSHHDHAIGSKIGYLANLEHVVLFSSEVSADTAMTDDSEQIIWKRI
ncbi:ABC transporter ATP-binding protein [Psychrobacter sp. I-STPA10]|uniref:ABC transporter ATP-binding protein n=1 Tax=Psychrobacter sp. I-STPA10 TaxID=2585769 RepID=UPI001E568DDB|nr:ABC transporter ATP-binding protein [Psychrobacter sp. I-STPA10]